MSCYKPIRLFRRPGSTKYGGPGLFKSESQEVPCGRCIGCRLERSRQWAIRCVHESSRHEDNVFLTLTYEQDKLPLNEVLDEHTGLIDYVPTLRPRDLQLFMKRLRKQYGEGIRFFACGEYGGITRRPHYHACIFGFDFEDKEVCNIKDGITYYSSVDCNRIWSNGNCVLGDVNFESAAYTARYIMDKQLGHGAKVYKELGIEPEFVRMSRRPGIGRDWIDAFRKDVYPSDEMVLKGGVKCRPPRYYDKVFDAFDPESMVVLKDKRKQNMESNEAENQYHRLKVRERVKQAQINYLARKKV